MAESVTRSNYVALQYDDKIDALCIDRSKRPTYL